MKKIIFLLSLLIWGVVTVNAQVSAVSPWVNDPRECTLERALNVTNVWSQSFDKQEGKKILCVKELKQHRVFTSIEWQRTNTIRGILRRVNSCSYSYSANGRPFDNRHPDWSYRKAESHVDGCPVAGWFAPNPEALRDEWKLYTKEYWFDNSNPTCGDHLTYRANIFGAIDPTPITYDGRWTNQRLFARFKCEDQYSGCQMPNNGISQSNVMFSRLQPLLYNIAEYSLSFADNVGNETTAKCHLNLERVYKFDNNPPGFTVTYVPNDSNENQKTFINTGNPDIPNHTTEYHFAGTKKMDINIEDSKPFSSEGSTGISEIQQVVLTSTKIKDSLGNPVENGISACSISENYTERSQRMRWRVRYDLDDVHKVPFSLECNYTQAGEYTFNISVTDNAGNKTERSSTIKVVPNNHVVAKIDEFKTFDNNGGAIANNQAYANHADKYFYKIHLEDSLGNRIHNKNFTLISPTGINLLQGVSSASALDIDRGSLLSQTDNFGGIGTFTISSYAPGSIKEDFSIQIAKWNERYQSQSQSRIVKVNSNQTRTFLPLFKAVMGFAPEIIDWASITPTELTFGQKQKLQFTFFKDPRSLDKPQNITTDALHSVTTNKPDEWKVTPTSSLIQAIVDGGTVVREFIPELLKQLSDSPNIKATPRINYIIDGKNVSYNVGKDYSVPVAPLTLEGGEVNSIYIGGQNQTDGDKNIVSQAVSVGNNSWVSARNVIAGEVANLIRNRQPNTTLNGVRYVTGDQVISGNVDVSTLIIEDGNLTVEGNLNAAKKKFAIILLNKNNSTKGNIYIKPNVAFVSALIFADGSIMSVDSNGSEFAQSTAARSEALKNQIVFHGGLYTRNTVGGAIIGQNNNYKLPGGKATNNIHEAIKYDLSFLRMKAGWKDDAAWTKNYNEWHVESVIVLPNREAMTNPPPGFVLSR